MFARNKNQVMDCASRLAQNHGWPVHISTGRSFTESSVSMVVSGFRELEEYADPLLIAAETRGLEGVQIGLGER